MADDFIQEDTEQRIKEFEEKLKAKQDAMPDTSIRSTGGGINAPQAVYFKDESIPIYDSGTNKQIDRIDMKMDKLRRGKRTQVADEVDKYMREIRYEIEAREAGKPIQEPVDHTAPFIYAVPAILVILAIIVIIAMNVM